MADKTAALDTNSPLALLNSLTALTSLTSTSPRIREMLTIDGGLERLLDILRESCLPKEAPVPQDLWGLNGPPTARVITMDRANSLKHSLAFQCVVNIGVRGSETIRTRVVQSGALDLVAQILESWLKDHGISIYSGPLGSQAAVDAFAAGHPVPGTENLRRRERSEDKDRTERRHRASHYPHPPQAEQPTVASSSRTGAPSGIARQATPAASVVSTSSTDVSRPQSRNVDTDVDMADVENGESTDASIDADDTSIDDTRADSAAGPSTSQAQSSTTPRARTNILPMTIPSTSRPSREHDIPVHAGSVVESSSGDDHANHGGGIPRITSESNLVTGNQGHRPPNINIGPSRTTQLPQDPTSTQSSPMGTPPRADGEVVATSVRHGRRGTIIARQNNLAPRNDRETRQGDGGGREHSDGGEDIDLPAATIAAGIAAVNAQAMENNGPIIPDEPGPPPNVEIIETNGGQELDEPDPEAIAAEQARLDMEAGAPPGQPGAAQTPRNAPMEAPTPRQARGQETRPTEVQAQIIIANGAPRGFNDLGSYVGISSLLNPDGNRYSDDSILLSLQLLAYLSKYPHVRTTFHHPRRPIHPTFDLGYDYVANPLPERPAYSETPDIFSVVERLTFRPSPSDPLMFKIPPEIQYWAGVIMRNACRKDDARGGIRQCANMSCGKWEKFSREFAKCRRCRKAKYCSKECQSRAWQEGHRFWYVILSFQCVSTDIFDRCSSRNDQEPSANASAAASAAAAEAAQSQAQAEDEEDVRVGLEMGLSPEVVTRALAAARAAGIENARTPPGRVPIRRADHNSHS